MIDGVKFSVYGLAKDNLRQNPLLKFSEATYDGLRLRITPDACYVRGSLHRFKNRGEHNCDDFSLSDFGNTLVRLSSELAINPEILVFSNVEFGLNIPLPFGVDEFLQSIILYRGEKTAGVVREPHGIRVEFTEYIIKAYDKTKVLPKHAEKNTLRFEIDITRTRRIRNQLMDDNTTVVRTLSDLAQPAVWRCFGNELVRAFDALVIYDGIDVAELQSNGVISDADAQILIDGKQAEYWDGLTGKIKTRTFDRFAKLIDEYSTSTMKSDVRKLIVEKTNQIQNDVPKSPFQVPKSPFFVTNSPFFEDADFEEHTKIDVPKSHVDKGGFWDTPLSTFSEEIEEEKREDLKRGCLGEEEVKKEKKRSEANLMNGARVKRKKFDFGAGRDMAMGRCIVTGLPLSREVWERSSNSEYLTKSGVEWFQKHMPHRYDAVLLPLLPKMMRGEASVSQYREIARSIRTMYQNGVMIN